MTAATARQIAAIHTLAKSLGLDEDLRRAVIAAEANGKRSARDLSWAEAGRVIERLKSEQSKTDRSAPDAASKPARGKALPAGARVVDGPYGPKLRALWLTGWNLAVVRDRTDAALLAFCERQTGVAHPRWWHESRTAARAIEGLKAWIARDGGIKWPPRDEDPVAIKQAVVEAQCRRLEALGATPTIRMFDASLDDAALTLGQQLRRALTRQSAAEVA